MHETSNEISVTLDESNNNNNDIRIFLFRILNKKDIECFGCGIFSMWDTQDVRCLIMLDVQDVERLGCDIWNIYNKGIGKVQGVGCLDCGLLEMQDVGDVRF